MQLFDTHCHLDSEEFDLDRSQVLSATFELGVDKIIVPATTQQRWSNLLEMCNDNNCLYPALGLHPVYLDQHELRHLGLLESTLGEASVVAIGEVGLDYYLKHLGKTKQINLLEAQLSIAKNTNLPVILHCRKAYDDLVNLLTRFQLTGGIAHAFNGSLQHAHKLIDLGFKLGFGGMLTYERSNKLRNLAQALPLSSIVLETDAPDLTVSQHRGERNSPAYLPYVMQALIEVRDESAEEIASQVYRNSVQVFSLCEFSK